jgi:hypothetical protein
VSKECMENVRGALRECIGSVWGASRERNLGSALPALGAFQGVPIVAGSVLPGHSYLEQGSGVEAAPRRTLPVTLYSTLYCFYMQSDLIWLLIFVDCNFEWNLTKMSFTIAPEM